LAAALGANAATATVNFNMMGLIPAPGFASVILALNLGAGPGSIGGRVHSSPNLTSSVVTGYAPSTAMTLFSWGA